jgi:endonuclease YncB( thermonuclease family)
MRTLIIVLCLLATPALADLAGPASVIDGDTIEVHGQRIRLHGIDAPESRQLSRARAQGDVAERSVGRLDDAWASQGDVRL